MATEESNKMKGLIATGVFLLIILAWVWTSVAIYPQQSDQDYQKNLKRNDWYAALGRGDFTEAQRIQDEMGK
jgi:hypothetical protein